MGKPTGFMEYNRAASRSITPKDRIKNFKEFHLPLTKEKQQLQGARCMDCGVPFCQSGIMLRGATSGCPLNNLIPEWNDLIFNGQWEEAARRLLLTNNFPEFTGRVCPAPCEHACTCSLNGEAVTIKENEAAIIENAFIAGLMNPKKPSVRTGKNVAIIGSGPAGLAAAAQLNKRGHTVTVYERSDRVGGLLMYGIPYMKIEKEIIERRVDLMVQEGIKFITNADIGRKYKANKLLEEYDAVVLACGASQPRDIHAPGREAKGIYFAVDFLKSTTMSLLNTNLEEGTYVSAKDKNVVVIGGGDTGNDCIATAIRHGCKSVLQVEMMPKPPEKRADNNLWPQWARVAKVDYGQEEAIETFGYDPRIYESTVKEFCKNEKGDLVGVKVVQVKFIMNEETGRREMQEVEGSEQLIDADLVLIAAGFLGAERYVTDSFGVEVDVRTNVNTKVGAYQTNIDKVFTAGDMHRGQSLVVWAIKEGREAAKDVDKYLMGYTNLR